MERLHCGCRFDVVVFFFATRSRRPESWQCVDDDDEGDGETHWSGIGHLIKVSNISKLVGTIRFVNLGGLRRD